jgi:hypothetical protein
MASPPWRDCTPQQPASDTSIICVSSRTMAEAERAARGAAREGEGGSSPPEPDRRSQAGRSSAAGDARGSALAGAGATCRQYTSGSHEPSELAPWASRRRGPPRVAWY